MKRAARSGSLETFKSVVRILKTELDLDQVWLLHELHTAPIKLGKIDMVDVTQTKNGSSVIISGVASDPMFTSTSRVLSSFTNPTKNFQSNLSGRRTRKTICIYFHWHMGVFPINLVYRLEHFLQVCDALNILPKNLFASGFNLSYLSYISSFVFHCDTMKLTLAIL